jgi:3-deoxy-D-manno-octulosonic acid (KDO) 8-phosphate synthase
MHVLDIIQQRLNQQFFLVAGPCAVESKDLCFEVAEKVSKLTAERGFLMFLRHRLRIQS